MVYLVDQKLNIYEEYFADLYKLKDPQSETIADKLSLLSLSEINPQHQEILNAPITAAEIDAIFSLKTNLAPGLDGFTSEFYKMFKQVLVKWLWKLFNSCIQDKDIPFFVKKLEWY